MNFGQRNTRSNLLVSLSRKDHQGDAEDPVLINMQVGSCSIIDTSQSCKPVCSQCFYSSLTSILCMDVCIYSQTQHLARFWQNKYAHLFKKKHPYTRASMQSSCGSNTNSRATCTTLSLRGLKDDQTDCFEAERKATVSQNTTLYNHNEQKSISERTTLRRMDYDGGRPHRVALGSQEQEFEATVGTD